MESERQECSVFTTTSLRLRPRPGSDAGLAAGQTLTDHNRENWKHTQQQCPSSQRDKRLYYGGKRPRVVPNIGQTLTNSRASVEMWEWVIFNRACLSRGNRDFGPRPKSWVESNTLALKQTRNSHTSVAGFAKYRIMQQNYINILY